MQTISCDLPCKGAEDVKKPVNRGFGDLHGFQVAGFKMSFPFHFIFPSLFFLFSMFRKKANDQQCKETENMMAIFPYACELFYLE